MFVTSPNTTGLLNTLLRANRLCRGASGMFSTNLRTHGLVDIDTSCFASSQVGYFGNPGKDPINGPGVNNWDLGLQKTFSLPIKEQTKLEFRGEFFTAFN